MDYFIKIIVIFSILIFISGCVETRQSQLNNALALTSEHFKNTVKIDDDELDTVATLSTVNGFQEKRGLLGIVWDDNFIRAFIDKKTGNTTFQIYNSVWYKDEWQFYDRVNYETPNGIVTKDLTVIDRDVDCSLSSRYEPCAHNEHVAFTIDEDMLNKMASMRNYVQIMKYKLIGHTENDYNDGILLTEIAGLLEAVREYKQRLGLKVSSNPAINQEPGPEEKGQNNWANQPQ